MRELVLILLLLASCTHLAEQRLDTTDNRESYYQADISDRLETLRPVGPTIEINMTADRWSFTPRSIRVHKGDNVVVHIISKDIPHSIALSGYNRSIQLDKEERKTIQFTAQKGIFEFYCDKGCSDGNSEMAGMLIVE